MVKMLVKYSLSAIFILASFCVCDVPLPQFRNYESITSTESPLPFPACQVDNIECLRRGLRTFFFLMDSGHLGMTPVDPIILNSVTVAIPNEQMSFLLRKVNVTGARWTKLVERKFHFENGKNSVRFKSDLHVVGEITMSFAGRTDTQVSLLTMDLNEIETNITYSWAGQRGYDTEDYILISQERISVRNSRTPTFFLKPRSKDACMIERVLLANSAIIDFLANEVTVALMHTIVDNIRLFAHQVPVKNYYIY